jgi:predicted transposase YbfD/YdcC
MEASVMEEVVRQFAQLSDPRRHNRLHPLVSLVTIAVLAVLCNADRWAAVVRFARQEGKWLELFVPLPHGIPSRQTFERVFALLKPQEVEKCVAGWFKLMNPWSQGALKQVAIHGKALRHSYCHSWDDSGMGYLVSAFASENGLVMAQVETEGKGQELLGIRQLLQQLQLKGCLVSIDALGCQKDIAQKIVEEEGDYCLAVKDNQPTLHRKVSALLDEGMLEGFKGWDAQMDQTTHSGHGRIETRTVWVTPEIQHLGERVREWPKLAAIAVVESRRTVLGKEPKTTKSRRYYILWRALSVAQVQQVVRGHWGIENGLHYILDVSYGEDASRIRRRSATHFSRLRRPTMNMLKKERSVQGSVAEKRERCALSREYRLKVIAASLPQQEPPA